MGWRLETTQAAGDWWKMESTYTSVRVNSSPAPSVFRTEHFSLYKYTVKTPSYQTEKGIAVGDTEEKLLKTYGPAKDVKEQDGVYEYYYVVDEGRYLVGDTELVFSVDDKKIVNWYVCNPWEIEFDASN
jgi:hypothetical protein